MRHAGGLRDRDKILHLTQQDPLPGRESGPTQAGLEPDAGHVGSPNSRGTFLRGQVTPPLEQGPPGVTFLCGQGFLPLSWPWVGGSLGVSEPASIVLPPTPKALAVGLGSRPLPWHSPPADGSLASNGRASASHSGPRRGRHCPLPFVSQGLAGLRAASCAQLTE